MRAGLQRLRTSLLVLALWCLSGCAVIINNAVDGVADNLTKAMLNQDDPETVRQAAPAYLLLLDSFVQGDPDNPRLLHSTAALYAAYGGVFVDEPERAIRLTNRAWKYSQKALCIEFARVCNIRGMSFPDWESFLLKRDAGDVETLFGLATSWLAYIQASSGDWGALAELPKVEALLERLVAIDSGYEEGNIYLYLGVLNSIRPPALGGKPEKGRDYFERAITLSGGTDLGAKVSYARVYARTLYERELHDELLNEVLAADPSAGSSTLLNVIAQEQARRLLASADDYF